MRKCVGHSCLTSNRVYVYCTSRHLQIFIVIVAYFCNFFMANVCLQEYIILCTLDAC